MRQALLDTDTVSGYLRGHPRVAQKVKEQMVEFGAVSISIISYYEIMSGLLYRDARKQTPHFLTFVELSNVLPITIDSAQRSAEISADLRKRGAPIEPTDILIAGTALANNLLVATNNTTHFRRIKNLEIENWME